MAERKKKPAAVSPQEPRAQSRKPKVVTKKVAENSNIGLPTSDIQNNSDVQNKSEIEHPKSEIPKMEVHHHPEVEKKGIKEYLLEGLMIFIAVFMGFIAENVREGIVEKHRAHEYMKEMVANLQFDAARCVNNINSNLVTIKGLDSLRDELKKGAVAWDAKTLYYLAAKYGVNTPQVFHANFDQSAITELRSSGSLRLIDEKTVESIADYYDRQLVAIGTRTPDDQATQLNKTGNEFFDWKYLEFTLNDKFWKNGPEIIKEEFTSTPVLLKSNKADLEKLYNAICIFEVRLRNYNWILFRTSNNAKALINSINKAYPPNND
ncbi:hypothetical protein [uncultured Mucilaginibacter sp.]|uniref:hypothetical protein n=1 Tax=uncultured Mucilaginibacter sp. TaxID=797541 RepID=UPI0025F0495E|nr:hypothetical protein [uncultured Mucilaginibacter sp.]